MGRLNEDQKAIVEDLLSGELTLKQLNARRSDARRFNNITLSISLAMVNEVYKYTLKGDNK